MDSKMSNTDPPQTYNDVRAAIMATLRLGFTVWLFADEDGFYLVMGPQPIPINDNRISDYISQHLIEDQHKIAITNTANSTYLRVSSFAFNRYKDQVTQPKPPPRPSAFESAESVNTDIDRHNQENERITPLPSDLDKIGARDIRAMQENARQWPLPCDLDRVGRGKQENERTTHKVDLGISHHRSCIVPATQHIKVESQEYERSVPDDYDLDRLRTQGPGD